MNLDKITVDDMMEFLGIKESTRQNLETRDTVHKFMVMFLPTISSTPKFIQFYNKKYGKEDHYEFPR